MKKILLLSTIAGIAASVAAVAPAMSLPVNTTTAGTINVSATTLPLCTAPGNINVALGQYNGTTTIAATNNILFKCTSGTTGTVTLTSANATTNPNTSGNLVSPAGTTPIAYTFTGNGSSGIGTGLTASASNISIPSVISVPTGQNPIPGSYSDTISVTVSY